MTVVPFPARGAAEDIDVRVFRAATEAYDRGEFEEGWRLVVLSLIPRSKGERLL